MNKILKRFLAVLIILFLFGQNFVFISSAQAKKTVSSYTTYKDVYKNSFNEYRYLIFKEFLVLKRKYDVSQLLDVEVLKNLKQLTEKSYNYLPSNNLVYENAKNDVIIAIEKAIAYPNIEATYVKLVKSVGNYLDNIDLPKIEGTVDATPSKGNAPLIVTLRAKVKDTSGEILSSRNYTWYVEKSGKKIKIGNGQSINYTFREEGIFDVFVDVKSSHRNNIGNIDVLPYEGRVKINVENKIASLILKVNGDRVLDQKELKFTPGQAKYGLLFDATSSIPSGATRFTRTTWDFGNSITKSYSGRPKIERVVYNKEGDYKVELTLKTNTRETIHKTFIVSVHDPIAVINAKPKSGFLGDKFKFSAKDTTSDDNLTYSWTIIDAIQDKVILTKQAKTFSHIFNKKGSYNIKLQVTGLTSQKQSIDTKIITIDSRAPIANFKHSIPQKSFPNRVLLDATSSYDEDEPDTDELKYSWEIDGKKVFLEDANENGALGYYTFDEIGKHDVILTVVDPNGIESVKKSKVDINSILSVDFSANPIAIKRGQSINFKADSPNAQLFEWDFGDQTKKQGGDKFYTYHKYEKTGIFNVKLKVIDKNGKTNNIKRVVYVGNGDAPVAILDITANNGALSIGKNICKGQDALVVSKKDIVKFDAGKSIDVDGKKNNLDYTIKIGNEPKSGKTISKKFDELGCVPIILTVRSKITKTTNRTIKWIKVINLKPTLSAVIAEADNLSSDPVIVKVKAVGAKDPDGGVITSYLWYYYTDFDSDPQGFKSTATPDTKFVLPRIQGNYYFVVLLMDDAEDRISSEELGKKGMITLVGNDMNVPILELKTPDNTVHVGDEVIFNSKVHNIIKQDLAKTKKVEYFWDFDGDGFYDLTTKKGNIKHVFDKPGSYYVKLKVKYKGFTNTRVIEVNVVNSLKPDFDFISVGNKVIFFNQTTGSYNNLKFSLGDTEIIEDKDFFIHDYNDSKSSHFVELKVSDSTSRTKIKLKKVSKNILNLLKYRKEKNVLFTTLNTNNKNEIILKEFRDNFIVYFAGKNFGEIYADTNLNKDSQLTGAKDDDKDIKNSKESYIKIPLDNKKREQLIRVTVKDGIGDDSNIIVSKDYKIIKEYLQKDINLDEITFLNVSDNQKEKLNKLKELIGSISGDNARMAKMYFKKLKEEWGDENEKTKIIYEFDAFLDSANPPIQKKEEISNALEELLLKDADNNNMKSVALRALQGLIPKNIDCEINKDLGEYKTCKEYIDSSLEIIKVNDDLQENITLGKEILKIVGKTDKLTNKEKLDFKATLQNLIYGGVDNIPKDKIDEVQDDSEAQNDGGLITLVLKTIGYVLAGILIVILFGVIGWFIFHKISGNKQDLKEFIKEKVEKDSKEEEHIEKEKQKEDIFSVDNDKEEEKNLKIEKKEEFKLEKNDKDEKQDDIPDWLKGSSIESDNKIDINNKEGNKEQKINKQEKKEKEIEEESTKIEEDKKDEEFDLEKDTKIEAEDVPDWLKGSLEEVEEKKEENNKIEDKEEVKKKEENKGKSDIQDKKKIEEEKDTKIETEDVPDWLKGSLEEAEEKKEKEEGEKNEKIEDKKIEKKEEVKDSKEDKGKETNIDNEKIVKKPRRKATKTTTKIKEDKKPKTTTEKAKKIETKKQNKTTKTKQKDETKSNKKDVKVPESQELWDDGMDIPDWLKN